MPTATDLRELDAEELESRLSEYRRELLSLRFQLATGQLDNAARLSQVRKDIARTLTVLREREIAEFEVTDDSVRAKPVSARRQRPSLEPMVGFASRGANVGDTGAADDAGGDDGDIVDAEIIDVDDPVEGTAEDADETRGRDEAEENP
jgi:large subunit ribosomal protein L29